MDIAILKLSDIVIKPDRQRKDFDKAALKELGQRIKTLGLLHAPGISTLESKILVYGERRIKILKFFAENGVQVKFNGELLPLGYGPFVVAGTDDEVALEEMELYENTARQDLTWQENTRAVDRIKELLTKRALRANPELQLEDVKITTEQIAEQANLSRRVTVEEINIAEHLDDPEVAKAKTKKDALKLIAKKKTQEFRAQAAATVTVEDKDQVIAKGDCRELIKKLPAKMFRSVITDPPYGIEMHKDKSWDGTWHEYDDSEAYCFNLIYTLLPEWDRVTRDEAHLYIFCDFDKFQSIRKIVEDYRRDGEQVFDVMYFPFIWNKGNVASYPRPDHWPRKSYECVLFAIKGNHENQTGKLDLAVIDIPQIQNQDHPAGKPVDLYERLVLRSTLAGEAVLDCFAGQGNLLRACRKNKRTSVSFELSDTYYPLLAAAQSEGNKNE